MQPPPQFGEEIRTIRQNNSAGLFFGEMLPSHRDYAPQTHCPFGCCVVRDMWKPLLAEKKFSSCCLYKTKNGICRTKMIGGMVIVLVVPWFNPRWGKIYDLDPESKTGFWKCRDGYTRM